MLRRLITAALIVGAALAQTSCVTNSSSSTSSADAEFDALQALAQELRHNSSGSQSNPEDELVHVQDVAHALHNRGLAFMRTYPTDPRRWDIIVQMEVGPYFTLKFGRGGVATFPIDNEASAAWDREYQDMLLKLIAAPDSSRNARKTAYLTLIRNRCDELKHLPPSDAHPGIAEVRQWLADFDEQDLGPGALGPLYHTVASMLEYVAPEECAPLLRDAIAHHSSSSPYDEHIRKIAAGRLRFLRGKEQPVDELWADLGRYDTEVADPMRYRGKVVLVTIFPADWENQEADLNTWYKRYHEAGLEIIQVTGFNYTPSAPPVERERTAMEAYVASKHWPWKFIWVQDGPEEKISGRWGVISTPGWLIVGRDGRFIADGTIPRKLDDFFADLFAANKRESSRLAN